jgi:hypothetical protein
MRCMDDARFDQLMTAWRTAEDALERYVAAGRGEQDAAVRRVLAQQLQRVAGRRYGLLCKYVSSCRARLRQL